MKSVHRDVALWRYENASRGYFGFHLRARSEDARHRFSARIAALTPQDPHTFHLSTDLPDALGVAWPRVFASEVVFATQEATQGALTLQTDQLAGLLELLDTVSPDHESSVMVETDNGVLPLWVWWDV